MPTQTLSTFLIGDIAVRYVTDTQTGAVGLILFPSALEDRIAVRRSGLAGQPEIDGIPGAGNPPAYRVTSLVQLKIVGDPYSGAFAQGRTMLLSPSTDRFKLREQKHEQDGDRQRVLTYLRADDGCEIEHQLAWHSGDLAIEVGCTFINRSLRSITLEMLSSFALAGITPFDTADAPKKLRAHRFRSVWSAEGRLETQSIEQLHLERSWSGSAIFSERFGQVGSMPVRGWFPFVAVEDTAAGVTWGAQLAWAGSWQMEIARQHDDVCITGGLADRELGHWMKTLSPGESLATPPATLSCVQGDLDTLCDRLTAVQQRACDAQPAVERDLPIVFNEWCTTWGDPSQDKIVALARRLRGSPTRYLVIDAGWYKGATGDWNNSHGDWQPSTKLFPQGLAAAANAIREQGLIPGLWFEMETVGETSRAFGMVDLLLQRDGIPITVRSRRFWDLNNAAAIDYLSQRVIDVLERCGFGYLKVDYNETIGMGCESQDDPNKSLGEGLRLQVEGVYRFFDKIRARLPDLVIESCSSGGHRLEPSMIGRTAMSSFSDAHELVEIPMIAANLHRLMLPRQSQIWAVLHGSDSDRRLIYSLAATFLGRMCISGDIDQLSDSQMRIVANAQTFYREVWPIIKDGTSRRFGDVGESWRHSRGWQSVVRTAANGNSVLIVIHRFAGDVNEMDVPLPSGPAWEITGTFGDGTGAAKVENNRLRLTMPSQFQAMVVIVKR